MATHFAVASCSTSQFFRHDTHVVVGCAVGLSEASSIFVFSVLTVGNISNVTSAGPTDWVRYPQVGCLER